MNFGSIANRLKRVVDKRGGTEALKEDLGEPPANRQGEGQPGRQGQARRLSAQRPRGAGRSAEGSTREIQAGLTLSRRARAVVRWRKVDNPDVIDQRPVARLPGRRVALPGGLGVIGVVVFLLIQALGGGSGDSAFSVDDPFGQGVEAPAAEPGDAIPPGQDPQKDLKDFSAYVFTDAQGRGAPSSSASGRRTPTPSWFSTRAPSAPAVARRPPRLGPLLPRR